MDASLLARLAKSGVDPEKMEDPAQAWRRLFDTFAHEATATDRLALEAAWRGIAVDDLTDEERNGITEEVLTTFYPEMELVGESRGEAVEIIPSDPGWPATFVFWRQCLAEGLGERAVRIDHVGSTAVPGLAAKPIVDIQVSVMDAEDEDSYVAAIESLGPGLRMREPGHRYFRPLPGQPRLVQIHVCEAGSEWERVHLLFRDYLRAHSEAAKAYGALKQRLARRFRNDRLAYTEAKSEFILETLVEAESWANESRWIVG